MTRARLDAALRVADFYTSPAVCHFGDGDERNRMAQTIAVLAGTVRELRNTLTMTLEEHAEVLGEMRALLAPTGGDL